MHASSISRSRLGLWLLLALSLLFVSCCINGTYGAAIWGGTDPVWRWPYASGFVTLDLTKFAIAALLPLTICQRRHGLAAGFTALLVVLCGLSMWANFAIAQRGHITSSGIAIAQIEQLKSLQAERARLLSEYQPLAGNGDAEALKRQMQVLKLDSRWDRTEQCTDAMLTASREFCAEHAALFSQVAAANRAQQLQERISQLSSQIRSYTTPETAVAGRDPFDVAAEQLWIETELLRIIVLASFVIAIELCGIICCAVASDRSLHLQMQQPRHCLKECRSSPNPAEHRSFRRLLGIHSSSPSLSPTQPAKFRSYGSFLRVTSRSRSSPSAKP